MTAAKKPPKAKLAILKLDYRTYVMPVDDALAVVKLMKNAELVDHDFAVNGVSYRRNHQEFELSADVVNASNVV